MTESALPAPAPSLSNSAVGALLLLVLVVSLLAVGRGPAALLYAALYCLAVLPGLPLGFALFGRRHPAGWIAGFALGYPLAVIAIWVAIRVSAPTPGGLLASLIAIAGLAWAGSRLLTASRRRQAESEALAQLPPWSTRTTVSLALVLLVTLTLAAPPLANVGARDAQGNLRYRAYFTADFVWHTALTSELSRLALPAHNPYLAPRPLHYYWGYFMVPAAIARAGPAPLRDVERCLRLNALLTGVVLMSALFLAVWTAVLSPVAAAGGTLLALCASSLEGVYALWRVWSRGAPLDSLRQLNVDALTSWYFQGHRIDGLPRCLWYVPQHSMAYALGFVALAAGISASEATLPAIVLTGVALAGSALLNPFVGGVFALVWGATVCVRAFRERRDPLLRLARHAIAAIPVAFAILWCVSNGMVEGAGSALEFGLDELSRQSPFLTFTLSFGPLALAALGGLLAFGPSLPPRANVTPAVLLAVACVFLMYFVSLNVDREWVPFRAGQMLSGALAFLAARWFATAANPGRRRIVVAAGAILFALGAPTTIIDAYNARDVWNEEEGPSSKWTLVLSPAQQDAFAWIREHTPRLAIVQMEPIVRQRDSWSLIPSFAQRGMAAGLPISLLRVTNYQERSDQVKTMFETTDAAGAARIAHSLHIRYLYVDATDRAAYPAAAKFDTSPQFFEPVFRREAVGVYLVR